MQLNNVMTETLALPFDTIDITPLSGEIINVQYGKIPIGAAATAVGTLVTLEFMLEGCVDELVSPLYYADVQDDQVTFYVTALNVHTKRSQSTACLLPVKVSKQMFVQDRKFARDQVQVIFLNMPLMETTISPAENQSETKLADSVKNAVFQEIERRADVDPNTLKVIRAESRVWSDSCLGVSRPGVFCLQVLTPGWIVEVEGKNQRWVYHTNLTGTSVVEAGLWSESSGISISEAITSKPNS
jgi:hypothetical protein